MYVLAIETTGKYGTAAVIRDDGCVFAASSDTEMNHLRDIISISDEAIKRAGIDKMDLTHVAASRGPGSFTGIRIGVTTARTLSQILGIPCVAVSSLEAMAYRVLDAAADASCTYVVPLINARRHQVYAGIWEIARAENSNADASENDSGKDQKRDNIRDNIKNRYSLKASGDEKQYMIEELLDELKKRICNKDGIGSKAGTGSPAAVFFTGDGIDAYSDIIHETLAAGIFIEADESIRYQHAEDVARIAIKKAAAGQTLSYNELLPEYMRLAEAEQRLKAGTLSEKIKKAGGLTGVTGGSTDDNTADSRDRATEKL
ncbi:MAG: tRNA (adenosine(37)-N6)-threonylcarbamoyltransferase complex dimerization subunit type 1 TsaB [Mogibacterium sp.]|nr:tRNA (adenosine(37)-N6)-threonylcarbamoyltransferase complex dimerization subunit type 1 TsaB [Mogibacterium sp.]